MRRSTTAYNNQLYMTIFQKKASPSSAYTISAACCCNREDPQNCTLYKVYKMAMFADVQRWIIWHYADGQLVIEQFCCCCLLFAFHIWFSICATLIHSRIFKFTLISFLCLWYAYCIQYTLCFIIAEIKMAIKTQKNMENKTKYWRTIWMWKCSDHEQQIGK